MKNILLFVPVLFYFHYCPAQELVSRKRNVTLSVVERYHTLIKTDKEVKQGLFQAFYKKTLIANGQYTDDKQTGVWLFYDKDGELIERYNFDTNNLLGEAVEDSTSSFRYNIDEKLKSTDQVTKPVRIGGRLYAYVPYLKLFKVPADMESFRVVIELLVSPGGRLADLKMHIGSIANGRIIYPNPDLLTESEKEFIPATVNGKPMASRIFIHCHLNGSEELDID